MINRYVNSTTFLKLPWLVLCFKDVFFFCVKKNINTDTIQNINSQDNNVIIFKCHFLYCQILQE